MEHQVLSPEPPDTIAHKLAPEFQSLARLRYELHSRLKENQQQEEVWWPAMRKEEQIIHQYKERFVELTKELTNEKRDWAAGQLNNTSSAVLQNCSVKPGGQEVVERQVVGVAAVPKDANMVSQWSSEPLWCPDSSAPCCHSCGVMFGFFARRHHCRNCGLIFCASCCSRRSWRLQHAAFKEAVPVCDTCHHIIQTREQRLNRSYKMVVPAPRISVTLNVAPQHPVDAPPAAVHSVLADYTDSAMLSVYDCLSDHHGRGSLVVFQNVMVFCVEGEARLTIRHEWVRQIERINSLGIVPDGIRVITSVGVAEFSGFNFLERDDIYTALRELWFTTLLSHLPLAQWLADPKKHTTDDEPHHDHHTTNNKQHGNHHHHKHNSNNGNHQHRQQHHNNNANSAGKRFTIRDGHFTPILHGTVFRRGMVSNVLHYFAVTNQFLVLCTCGSTPTISEVVSLSHVRRVMLGPHNAEMFETKSQQDRANGASSASPVSSLSSSSPTPSTSVVLETITSQVVLEALSPTKAIRLATTLSRLVNRRTRVVSFNAFVSTDSKDSTHFWSSFIEVDTKNGQLLISKPRSVYALRQCEDVVVGTAQQRGESTLVISFGPDAAIEPGVPHPHLRNHNNFFSSAQASSSSATDLSVDYPSLPLASPSPATLFASTTTTSAAATTTGATHAHHLPPHRELVCVMQSVQDCHHLKGLVSMFCSTHNRQRWKKKAPRPSRFGPPLRCGILRWRDPTTSGWQCHIADLYESVVTLSAHGRDCTRKLSTFLVSDACITAQSTCDLVLHFADHCDMWRFETTAERDLWLKDLSAISRVSTTTITSTGSTTTTTLIPTPTPIVVAHTSNSSLLSNINNFNAATSTAFTESILAPSLLSPKTPIKHNLQNNILTPGGLRSPLLATSSSKNPGFSEANTSTEASVTHHHKSPVHVPAVALPKISPAKVQEIMGDFQRRLLQGQPIDAVMRQMASIHGPAATACLPEAMTSFATLLRDPTAASAAMSAAMKNFKPGEGALGANGSNVPGVMLDRMSQMYNSVDPAAREAMVRQLMTSGRQMMGNPNSALPSVMSGVSSQVIQNALSALPANVSIPSAASISNMASNPDQQKKMIETIKKTCLDFLTKSIPSMGVPPIHGESDLLKYNIENVHLSGFKVLNEHVTVVPSVKDKQAYLHIKANQVAFRIVGCRWRIEQKKFPFIVSAGFADCACDSMSIEVGICLALISPTEPGLSITSIRVALQNITVSLRGSLLSRLANVLATLFSNVVRENVERQINNNIGSVTNEMVRTMNSCLRPLCPSIHSFLVPFLQEHASKKPSPTAAS
eukprot:c368_g1_i2.p1 GENE.c368_g1_i2~~c368_g1_i2.p1  ORF type:complete len:1319 (+),score=331.37 c368_g1_i2:197-4153(+)